MFATHLNDKQLASRKHKHTYKPVRRQTAQGKTAWKMPVQNDDQEVNTRKGTQSHERQEKRNFTPRDSPPASLHLTHRDGPGRTTRCCTGTPAGPREHARRRAQSHQKALKGGCTYNHLAWTKYGHGRVKVKVAQPWTVTRLYGGLYVASTVHGILLARMLEWVAFPFSRGSSQPKDRTQVSCIAGGFFTN